MQITDVRIRVIEGAGKLKAVATITIDNEFAIHDIKIIETEVGLLFMAMPSRKTPDGEFKDICHPINQDAREKIEKEVLEKYRAIIE